MRALGVALAACCAVVLWPSALHADPIRARDAAERTKLATIPGSQVFDGDHDADEGTFTAQAGLDHSIHFAATGTIDVFNDDHPSLGNVIDVEGLSTADHQTITVGLVAGHHDADNDHQGSDTHSDSGETPHGMTPPLQLGPKVSDPPIDPAGGVGTSTSATPEPASMLLLATGLAGVILYRRQLFA
ncbi:MAG TPA: PEP-CTERM sorting domain-containing protein [Vicinamibacterales bacterium]|nr:PEP-CTERM sorting domain-containing protein [Vicinamibacterales bacterium]